MGAATSSVGTRARGGDELWNRVPFFLCWARISVGDGERFALVFCELFDIVHLNRDVEASMEFFCSSVCFMWNGEPFSLVFCELTI